MCPYLFSRPHVFLYRFALLTLVKFADDMALVAHLQDENSLAEYFFHLDFTIQGKFSVSKYFKIERTRV